MAEIDSVDVVGGEVFIVMEGKRFEGFGELSLSPTLQTREARATSGGRLMVTVEAKPATATISFVNHSDADPLELWEAFVKVDITFVEKSRGIRHLFTQAAVVGEPQINTATGEVSGLEIASDQYSRA